MPQHPNTRLCAYTKVDGKQCGAPAWEDFDKCWHHHGLKSRFEAQQFRIPALDDANAVQVATMDVINALITRRIDRSDAYALFYGLYLAKSNLKGTTLSPPTPNDLADMLEDVRRQSYEKGRIEGEKQAREKREREDAARPSEDNESLAAYLLRELKESADQPQPVDPPLEREWWNKPKTTGTNDRSAPGK